MYSYRKKLNYVMKKSRKCCIFPITMKTKNYSKFYSNDKNANVMKLSREICFKL